MSHHTKFLASAVLAAAIGVLGSQARADLGFSFSGADTISSAGQYTYTLNANWTGLTAGTSVALWDVAGYMSPVAGLTLSGPAAGGNFSFAVPASPSPAFGDATNPLYFRTAAVDNTKTTTIGGVTYYAPAGVPATADADGKASVAVANFVLTVAEGYTAGPVSLSFNLAAPAATVYPNVIWSQGATGMSDYKGPGAVAGQDLQTVPAVTTKPIDLTTGTPTNILHVPGTGTTPVAGTHTVSQYDGLDYQAGGKLDLGSNYIIFHNTDAAAATTLRAQLQTLLGTGLNGGDWAGTGIISSAAAGSSGQGAVGYAVAGDLGFDGTKDWMGLGVKPVATDVLLAYTWWGDMDLNGIVDGIDFNSWLGALGNTGDTWSHGDTDYNGIIDGIDFNHWLSTLGNSPAPAEAVFGAAAVPEPASLALLALGLLGLTRRGGRR